MAAGKIIPAIAKLIWLGLLFLIISGIALIFLVKWPLDKNMLIIKHIPVALIVIISVTIGVKTRKKKDTRLLGKINLVLWYLVTLLSVFV